MPETDRHTGGGASAPQTLAERLRRERERLFVGRREERRAFDEIVAGKRGTRIVAVSGPAGIGKSMLVERLIDRARECNAGTAVIDAQLLPEATPKAMEATVTGRIGAFRSEAPVNILCIDNIEHIAAMEHWIRQTLPELLPANAVLILAGRWRPPTTWQADPAVGAFYEHWRLTTLSIREADYYLKLRRLNDIQRRATIDFAQGHPLATALAADQLLRTNEQTLKREQTGEMIQRLIDWMFSAIKERDYRDCLEAAATVHFVNEPVLSFLVPQSDADTLYRWLAAQPFMSEHESGLLMHELARTVIIENLRRRNLPQHHALIRRAADFYINDIGRRPPETVHFSVAEWAYTVRWEPYMRRYYDMGPQSHYLDDIHSDELKLLADTVAYHEGDDARRWFVYWSEKQPELLYAARDDNGRIRGFMLGVLFGEKDTDRDYTDPAVQKYLDYFRSHNPLRGPDKALLIRFIMTTDTYQQTGPAFTQLEMKVNSLVFLDGLVHFAVVCDAAKDWRSSAENANFKALPDCTIATSNRRQEIRGCDLKAEPPLTWIRNTVERMLGGGHKPGYTAVTRGEFAEAVLDAMRRFHNDTLLAENRLLESHLLNRNSWGIRPVVGDLRKLITDTLQVIDKQHPGKRLPEVIDHNYFRAGDKQITAAAAMSISESTFRRRLRLAESAMIEHLWKREIEPDRHAPGQPDN